MKIAFKYFSKIHHLNFRFFIAASLLFSCIGASQTEAQTADDIDRKNKILAAYLIGFVKFIEFPTANSNEYNFCISGDQKLADSVNAAARRSVPDKTINAYIISSTEKTTNCKIIYFDKNSALSLNNFSAADKTKFISVSDVSNFIKNNSGMIEMKEASGRYNFAIDVEKIEKQGFKVSSKLVELAEVVY